MADGVECTLEIPVQYPAIVRAVPARAQPSVALLDGLLAAASRAEALAVGLKAGFPAWFQGSLHHGLCDAVFHGGTAQRSEFSIGFRNVDPLGRLGLPQSVILHLLDQLSTRGRRERRLAIKARRLASRALLGHVSHRHEQVGVTA